MRKTWLTLALVGMIALPVLAQRFGGFGMFGGGQGGDNLLTNKSVQKELKLDDKQAKAIEEIQKKFTDSFREAFEAGKDGDKEKAQEIIQKAGEARTKALKSFKDSLTSEQQKRFQEIEVQISTKQTDPNLFKHSGVQKALKLTSKQQETVKETLSDLEKDTKEVMSELKGGGKGKGKGIFQKLGTMRKEAYEKITKSLTDDQQKSLKELAGKEFEFVPDNPFGKGKGKFGKGGKDKKKKDDF
jgi:Spy/CpxP family protein refolding chaperone